MITNLLSAACVLLAVIVTVVVYREFRAGELINE